MKSILVLIICLLPVHVIATDPCDPIQKGCGRRGQAIDPSCFMSNDDDYQPPNCGGPDADPPVGSGTR